MDVHRVRAMSLTTPFATSPDPRPAVRDRDVLRALTRAVNAHRRSAIAAGLEPEPHDLDLWAHLDVLRLRDGPDGQPGPTLAEMLTTSPKWGAS